MKSRHKFVVGQNWRWTAAAPPTSWEVRAPLSAQFLGEQTDCRNFAVTLGGEDAANAQESVITATRSAPRWASGGGKELSYRARLRAGGRAASQGPVLSYPEKRQPEGLQGLVRGRESLEHSEVDRVSPRTLSLRPRARGWLTALFPLSNRRCAVPSDRGAGEETRRGRQRAGAPGTGRSMYRVKVQRIEKKKKKKGGIWEMRVEGKCSQEEN